MLSDPEKQKLLKHKEDLEQSIDELKYRKASMAVQEYREATADLPGGAGEDAGGAGQVNSSTVNLLVGQVPDLPGFEFFLRQVGNLPHELNQ